MNRIIVFVLQYFFLTLCSFSCLMNNTKILEQTCCHRVFNLDTKSDIGCGVSQGGIEEFSEDQEFKGIKLNQRPQNRNGKHGILSLYLFIIHTGCPIQIVLLFENFPTILSVVTFIFESVNKVSPVCFHNFLTFNASVHQYQTRQAGRGDLYLTQKKILQYRLKSINYLACKLQKDLPFVIGNSPSKV